ncbi:MAG: amidase domain-containing protein [Clostridiales bacterium]|nr:amidase domain-containing protein [Clostridiales bacterium]
MRNGRYTSIVSIIIGAILLVTIFIPSTSYATEYSVNKSVAYAQKWAKNYNDKQYKRINDDCTNFVSQCVVAGGKRFVAPSKVDVTFYEWLKGYKYTNASNMWYHKKYPIKKFGISKDIYCYSTSFTFVDSFYNYWKKQKGCCVYEGYSGCKKGSKFQKDIKKGDIIQMYDKNEGWHHSMIVTSGKMGIGIIAHIQMQRKISLYINYRKKIENLESYESDKNYFTN